MRAVLERFYDRRAAIIHRYEELADAQGPQDDVDTESE